MDKKKNIKLIILLSISIVAIIIISIILLVKSNSPEKRLQAQLDLGCKYLEELNYEQAIAAFDVVLSIDPKNEKAIGYMSEAYIGWAESEEKDGNVDRALEILYEGYEKTSDDSILKMIKRLENASDDDMYENDTSDDNVSDGGDPDENSSYRALADDIWRLMDFQAMGKPVPAWRTDNVQEYVTQNYRNVTSEYTSEDGSYYYMTSDGINLHSFNGQVYVDVTNDSNYSLGFYTFEYDEIALYMYTPGQSIVSQFPLFGMTAREYLDSFGLGDVIDEVQNQDEKLVCFSDTDYITIKDYYIEVYRVYNKNNRWIMESISIFYEYGVDEPICNIHFVFDQDTESFYG